MIVLYYIISLSGKVKEQRSCIINYKLYDPPPPPTLQFFKFNSHHDFTGIKFHKVIVNLWDEKMSTLKLPSA